MMVRCLAIKAVASEPLPHYPTKGNAGRTTGHPGVRKYLETTLVRTSRR